MRALFDQCVGTYDRIFFVQFMEGETIGIN